MSLGKKSLALHRRLKGKIEVKSKLTITANDLPLIYTPGVADVSTAIAKNKNLAFSLTSKWNNVAVVTDGTAVLGLGSIGPEAALPVMEGKCMLFKELGNVNAFPVCLDAKDPKDVVRAVRMIAPAFGGVNLEDIGAPHCFFIEGQLQDLGIPVMHDDQHGTGIVVVAALVNALKTVKKDLQDCRVSIMGAGAAGIGIARLLAEAGAHHVILSDSRGIIYEGRANLTKYKKEVAKITNRSKKKGHFSESFVDADAFVGVSGVPNSVKPQFIRTMADQPIVFPLSNPNPEIMPDVARHAGAAVVGTGRSDLPNQINNALAFPGVFRGALDARAKTVTVKMKLAAAYALANSMKPTAKQVLPHIWDKNYVSKVAAAVARSVMR